MFQLHCLCKIYLQLTSLFWIGSLKHGWIGKCEICFSFSLYQQPAINTLREVEAFLSQNPTEIVTIIIEDYVHRPKGLSTLFANAGLDKYWFPVSKMPKKGEDWPTVTDMVQENHRLLVFTSVAAKEDEEGVAYQWRYMVENECEYHKKFISLLFWNCL